MHTVDNPAGEIWAFLAITGGSITDPGEPTADHLAGSTEFPILMGDDLEAEVRRFLDQATFGATEDDVTSLITQINTERQTAPDYHRTTAFEAWMDTQMELPQTHLVDYHIAMDYQQFFLRGWFDPTINPSSAELGIDTPVIPDTWPTPDRSTNSDPQKWHLSGVYPVNACLLYTSDAADD